MPALSLQPQSACACAEGPGWAARLPGKSWGCQSAEMGFVVPVPFPHPERLSALLEGWWEAPRGCTSTFSLPTPPEVSGLLAGKVGVGGGGTGNWIPSDPRSLFRGGACRAGAVWTKQVSPFL